MPINRRRPAGFVWITSLLTVVSLIAACGGGGGSKNAPVAAPKSSNTSLSTLAATGITLDQAFASGTLDYTSSVEFPVTGTQVTAMVADASARITVNGTSVASGVATGTIPLDVGLNTITVRVTAEDGVSIRSYNIDVMRQSPSEFAQAAYVKSSNSQSGDFFGSWVAISGDGRTMAVGSFGEDSSATGVNGDETDNGSPDSGAVYVFMRGVGGVWAQAAYLKPSNAEAGDSFVGEIDISDDGSTIAIGARNEDSAATGINGDQTDNSAVDSGAVYVFTRGGGGQWNQQAYVKASNTGAGDGFGTEVDLSGDGSTMAVSANGEDSSATGTNGNQSDNVATDAGAVYMFSRDNAGVWTQQAYIKASNSESFDYFGEEVDLSGDGTTLAVNADWEDSAATGVNGDQTDNSAPFSGAVYVFTRDTGSVWIQDAYIKASNTDSNDGFGGGMALSDDGSVLAISTVAEDSSATGIDGDDTDNTASNAGAAYVFTRNAGSWSQQSYIKASNAGASDFFGNEIDISDDGKTLAVSATGEDSSASGVNGNEADNSTSGSGAVYVFTFESDGKWKQQAYIKASNAGADDAFGNEVDLSDDGTVLSIGSQSEASAATGIGGDQADNSAIDSGAVYIFELNNIPGASPTVVITILSSNAYLILPDGTIFAEDQGGSVEFEADIDGGIVQLWSCGWPDPPYAGGCRYIDYTVFPGEQWEVVQSGPVPQIIMQKVTN